MGERITGPLSPEKASLAEKMLLDTSIRLGLNGQREEERGYNFEIQLPSLKEYCIDWTQTDYPRSLLNHFSTRQWRFDESQVWVDPGGIDVEEEHGTGRIVERAELEHDLNMVGVSLIEIASHYYPKALAAGDRGFVKRKWRSSFPKD